MCWAAGVAAACRGESSAKQDSAATPAAAAVVHDSSAVTTLDGIAPAKVGMSVQQLSAALGHPVAPAKGNKRACRYIQSASLPIDVALMLVNDTVARVDVDSTGAHTSEGAYVGDPESRVMQIYRGNIVVQPHKYTGPVGHYLIVTPPSDTTRRIIFETDGEKVLRYRVGRRPEVEFVEGCS